MVEPVEAQTLDDPTLDEGTETQLDAALEYARSHPPLPAARRVLFLRESRLLVLELKSSRRIAIPVEDVEDLIGATDDQIAVFELEGSGGSIHFPMFDGNLYVPALVEGIWGSREWMDHLPERWAASLNAAA